MRAGLGIGDKARFSRVVRAEETVPHLFPDSDLLRQMPDVLASAYMVALFEWACVEQLAPFYDAGEGSLGTGFELTHLAPTPPGLEVTVETEVESIDGRFIWFRVRGHDGHDLIGEGRHQRALIDRARFDARVAAKREVA